MQHGIARRMHKATWLHSDHKPGKYFPAALLHICGAILISMECLKGTLILWRAGFMMLTLEFGESGSSLCVCNILTGTKSETPVEQQRAAHSPPACTLFCIKISNTKMHIYIPLNMFY
jgi:hypothetical protein